MADPYFYDDIPVLRNTLDIKDEKMLGLIEAEQSRANMMLLPDAERLHTNYGNYVEILPKTGIEKRRSKLYTACSGALAQCGKNAFSGDGQTGLLAGGAGAP